MLLTGIRGLGRSPGGGGRERESHVILGQIRELISDYNRLGYCEQQKVLHKPNGEENKNNP